MIGCGENHDNDVCVIKQVPVVTIDCWPVAVELKDLYSSSARDIFLDIGEEPHSAAR